MLDPWPLKFIFDELILKGFDTSNSSIALLRNTSPITFLTVVAIGIVVIAILRAFFAYLSTVGMALAVVALVLVTLSRQ